MVDNAGSTLHRPPSVAENSSESTDPSQRRVSLRLSSQAEWAVGEIMRIANVNTIQDAIRLAISDELFLLKERSEGWKVKLERGNQEREVHWPDHIG